MGLRALLNKLTQVSVRDDEREHRRRSFIDGLFEKRRGAAPKPARVHRPRAGMHYGGKHYMGSHAPTCEVCRVTLSAGRCLNRMCGEGSTTMKTKQQRAAEQLKDRRDYRQTLLNRREEIDRKIKAAEETISKLKKEA